MDWKTIISDLVSEGLSQPQIAAKCECSQTTISELATGKTAQPRFNTGAALIKLHSNAKRKRAIRQRRQGQCDTAEQGA